MPQVIGLLSDAKGLHGKYIESREPTIAAATVATSRAMQQQQESQQIVPYMYYDTSCDTE
jgi:hypothetical protein